MSKLFQRGLLALGIIALAALIVEIVLSIGATMHGNTPQRVTHVQAGPYALTVNLYKDPANAGFALPFSIHSQSHGPLSYDVTSVPGEGVDGTPVRASISSDVSQPNSIQGNAEITVQGPWTLHILVQGPAGPGEADVPITATAPPAIPDWLGWLIGIVPLVGLFAFFLFLRRPGTRQISAAS